VRRRDETFFGIARVVVSLETETRDGRSLEKTHDVDACNSKVCDAINRVRFVSFRFVSWKYK